MERMIKLPGLLLAIILLTAAACSKEDTVAPAQQQEPKPDAATPLELNDADAIAIRWGATPTSAWG